MKYDPQSCIEFSSSYLQQCLSIDLNFITGPPVMAGGVLWIKVFKKKKLYGPFLLWMGFNCLKATATSGRQFTFYHSVPRNSCSSFYWPWKDERLSPLWSHPMVLITGPLDWKSSALTTRPLLHVCPSFCSEVFLQLTH